MGNCVPVCVHIYMDKIYLWILVLFGREFEYSCRRSCRETRVGRIIFLFISLATFRFRKNAMKILKRKNLTSKSFHEIFTKKSSFNVREGVRLNSKVLSGNLNFFLCLRLVFLFRLSCPTFSSLLRIRIVQILIILPDPDPTLTLFIIINFLSCNWTQWNNWIFLVLNGLFNV